MLLGCFLWLLYTPPLLLPFRLLQPPMLWSTRHPTTPPPHPHPHRPRLGEGRGGWRCPPAPARKKGLGGLLFLPSDIIYTGSSGLAVYCITQAGCGEGVEGGAWVVHALSPWRLCVDSISQPSFRKCQKSHLGGAPWGAGWDPDSPNVHQFLFNSSWSHVVVVFPCRALN